MQVRITRDACDLEGTLGTVRRVAGYAWSPLRLVFVSGERDFLLVCVLAPAPLPSPRPLSTVRIARGDSGYIKGVHLESNAIRYHHTLHSTTALGIRIINQSQFFHKKTSEHQ